MNEQEKIVKEILNRIGDFGVEQENMINFLEKQIKEVCVLAKKEVFYDISNFTRTRNEKVIGIFILIEKYQEIKQRHLSNSKPKEKK